MPLRNHPDGGSSDDSFESPFSSEEESEETNLDMYEVEGIANKINRYFFDFEQQLFIEASELYYLIERNLI